MSSPFIDILPKCPICQQSFYQEGVSACTLSCSHLFCSSCLPKLYSSSSIYCPFDSSCTTTAPQPTALRNWLQAGLNYYRTDHTGLEAWLKQYLPYNRAVLPCGNPAYHRERCEYDHSGRIREMSCPLGTECPNKPVCVLKHPTNLFASTTSFYSEQSMARPFNVLDSGNDGQSLPVSGFQSHSEPGSPQQSIQSWPSQVQEQRTDQAYQYAGQRGGGHQEQSVYFPVGNQGRPQVNLQLQPRQAPVQQGGQVQYSRPNPPAAASWQGRAPANLNGTSEDTHRIGPSSAILTTAHFSSYLHAILR